MNDLRRADVPPARTRVLLTLMAEHAAGRQPTHRSLSDTLGLSFATVHAHLDKLKAAGLVTWEPYRAGTLRPLVRVVARG